MLDMWMPKMCFWLKLGCGLTRSTSTAVCGVSTGRGVRIDFTTGTRQAKNYQCVPRVRL